MQLDFVWLTIGGILGGIALGIVTNLMGWREYLGGKKRFMFPPAEKQVLLDTLLGLNDISRPYRVAKDTESDFVVEWKLDDVEWQDRIFRHGLVKAYRARLLVDEGKRSVRWWEESGSLSWMKSAAGVIPRVSYETRSFPRRVPYSVTNASLWGLLQLASRKQSTSYEYQFDVNEIRGALSLAVEECGWEWVPVALRRHATHELTHAVSLSASDDRVFCENCGKQIDQGSPFCVHCGDKQGVA